MCSFKKGMVAMLAVITMTGVLQVACIANTSQEEEDPNDGLGMTTSAVVAPNGFTYPLSSMGSWTDGNFGACGSSYVTNLCHIGNDLSASQGNSVYSMAAGTVLA